MRLWLRKIWCPRNSPGMCLWCQSALPFFTLMNGRRKRSSRARLNNAQSRRIFLECPLSSWRPISVSQKCVRKGRDTWTPPGDSPLFAGIKISFELLDGHYRRKSSIIAFDRVRFTSTSEYFFQHNERAIVNIDWNTESAVCIYTIDTKSYNRCNPRMRSIVNRLYIDIINFYSTKC